MNTCQHILYRGSRFFYLVALLIIGSFANAGIGFEEATQNAQINYSSATYGASWGDINGDGWPDLWVGNHDSKPSLYLNNGDGTFTNIVDKVWNADPGADTHGAAWADFDNDGDQDLVELVGASRNDDGTLCIGCGQNHLFVNENGILVDRAPKYGVGRPGLARSPQWLDVDSDGKLDLVVVNTRRKGLPSTSVFLQKNKRFVESAKKTDLRDARWSRKDKLLATYRNLKRLEFSTRTGLMDVHTHLESVQLARISNNEQLDLLLLSSPSRIYAVDDGDFDDMTSSVSMPQQKEISDIAIEDFNGDGNNDLYIMKGSFLESDVIQVGTQEIKGTLAGRKGGEQNTLTFSANGVLEFQIAPTWRSLDKFYIGANGRHPTARSFTLSSADPKVRGSGYSKQAQKNKAISIVYDAEKALWIMRNFSGGQYFDFIIKAEQPIEDMQTIGFRPFRESGVDALLLRRGDRFVSVKSNSDIAVQTSCYSVVAADFDNDMDVDLYMVCTGPVANLPNRLFENDGRGNFRLVENAGGAAGSKLGRGDVAAIADFDRDGFMDIFVANGTDPSGPFVADGPHQLFRNLGNDNHWIELDLVGVKSNRDGIGAVVRVVAGGIEQIREQRGGMHRITQNHQRLHFGLGSNSKIDRLLISWPSGVEQELRDVPVDRILRVQEQAGRTKPAI